MILVKAKRDELLAPLSAVSGIIERRHTLPILSNVLIENRAIRCLFSRPILKSRSCPVPRSSNQAKREG